jgi:hypothetical protein
MSEYTNIRVSDPIDLIEYLELQSIIEFLGILSKW